MVEEPPAQVQESMGEYREVIEKSPQSQSKDKQ